MNDREFCEIVEYIRDNYGINLEKKQVLIECRMARELEKRGLTSFAQYMEQMRKDRTGEMAGEMVNRLTTNYTYFMREKEHFDFLQKQILPELANKHSRDRSIAIWSAGCSSGEEPYNISMYLKEFFSALPGSWDTRILATDISQRVLDSAMDPRYSLESLKELPPSWQERYFVPIGDKTYTVSDALRKNVIFRSFNLMDPIHFRKKFDLIFCRNVMIYFDRPTKAALVRRFYDATAPGGYLFIGHSESLDKESCPFSYIEPAIYRKI